MNAIGSILRLDYISRTSKWANSIKISRNFSTNFSKSKNLTSQKSWNSSILRSMSSTRYKKISEKSVCHPIKWMYVANLIITRCSCLSACSRISGHKITISSICMSNQLISRIRQLFISDILILRTFIKAYKKFYVNLI